MHSLRAIYIMWLRDMLRLRRDHVRVVTSLAQPVLWLLLIGSGLAPAVRLGATGPLAGPDVDYLKFMFPGVLAMSVLFTSMFSGMSVAWDRDFGFLKEVLVAPVPRWAVALGKILGGSTVAVTQASIMLLIAPLLGLRLDPAIIAAVLPLLLLIGFAITSMAVAIAVSVSSMEGFQMVSQFILMPMFMLSGAVFRRSAAPGPPRRHRPACRTAPSHLQLAGDRPCGDDHLHRAHACPRYAPLRRPGLAETCSFISRTIGPSSRHI